MEKKTKLGVIIAYVYLMLPFIIFVVGWGKLWIAMPMVFLLIICFWRMILHAPKLWMPELSRNNIEKIVIIFAVICLWVYLSGIGQLVFQNTDHRARNAIFDILVKYDWPVYGTGINGSEISLIYYIGFWLPSAIIGKIFGIRMGYWSQDVWAVLGITLVYYFICARTKKLEVWPLIVMILFSGLDYVGYYLLGTDMSAISQTMHLEWWNDPYQFSSMTTQLFWVFNQCIPIWVATVLIINLKDNRSSVLILATTMLTSTLPFVGLIPIVAYSVFSKKYPANKRWFSELIKEVVTLENIVGGGIIGIISFLYLKINVSGNMMSSSSKAAILNKYDGSLLMWMMCVILEVGIYLLLVYREQRDNWLFYIIAAELCFFPLIRVGVSSDFCMRAVIPAQIILMIYVIDVLRNSINQKRWLLSVVIIIVLGIGSITPIHEITRTCAETIQRKRDRVQVEEESNDYEDIFNSGNFSGEIKYSWFFKYFVKK